MQISPKEELISSTISSLSNHHLPIAPYTKLGFTSLHTVNKNKPYIPYSDCVLKHILHSLDLTNQEKLFYLIADSLSLISGQNATKKRAAALPATKWAKNLNCSKNEIFTMQKSLEAKGYFIVVRDKNEFGKNQRNIITPSLPDTVFHYLSKALNRSNNELTDNSPITSLTSSLAFSHCLNIEKNKIEENKRVYLDKTKLFIRLNYQLLLLITSSDQLTSFAKVLWLDFYTKCYKYHMKLKNTDTGNDNNNFACTTSYKELETKYSCTKATLSKTMNVLEKLGFIDKKRFHVKNDNKDDNLHDKSLWSVTLSLPKELALNILNLKPRLEYAYQANSKPNISSTDPYVANFGQLLNKDLKSNNKDSDSIDSEKIFSEKTNISSSKNLSELSVSYKNSLEKKTKEILLEKEQKIVSNKTNLPNIQESILKTETSNNLEEGKLKAIEEISETVREEQEKTLLLNQVNEQNNEQEQINTTNGLINTMAEMPVTSTTNLPNNSSSYNKSLSYNKQSTQDKSLKSFYPLTKEQVDKLNQLSNREFSNNFANQLLLKLYIRDPNKTFASTNHMISYMSKAFRYEKHQAPMVNHETFRFTANVSDPESVEMRQKEKYLTEVEYSMDTSYSSQLRKKIAGIFETKLAYQILTEGKFDYHATNEQNTSQESEITNNAWQNLELSEENNITQFEYVLDHSTCFVDSSLSLDSKHDIADINYDTQLSTNVTEENDQMKSGVVMTENDDINDKILTRELSELPLKSSLPARQFTRITLANTCTVKLPKYLILTNHQQQNLEKAISTVYGYVKIVYQQLPATYKKLGQSRLPDEIFLTELDQNSVWYKIRKKLIDNFDEHIDKAWFSKLRAEEDVITQKLTLIAPTNFLRDWINAKYSSFIKDIAKKLDYQFVELITKK